MLMVHHPSRVTEKESKHVCTIDEQRKVPMDKVGTIHGEMWSEVRNSHSRHVYLILTQPDLGSESWVTYLFSMVHKKALFAILTDERHAGLFTEEEREAIRAHVPWTRRVRAERSEVSRRQ